MPSPHETCQRAVGPYMAAERQRRRFGVVVLCHVCGAAWREIPAA